MSTRLNILLEEIKLLQAAVETELQSVSEKASYSVRNGKILFSKEVKKAHRSLRQSLTSYLFESNFLFFLTAPVIYSMLIPAFVLETFCSFYQSICFPVYKINKVRRKDYIRFDRFKLSYLNNIEKLNCDLCAYFNGSIAYAREIASRTEQYWCPIRHAFRTKDAHSRYKDFIPYGEAASYHERLEKLRQQLQNKKEQG